MLRTITYCQEIISIFKRKLSSGAVLFPNLNYVHNHIPVWTRDKEVQFVIYFAKEFSSKDDYIIEQVYGQYYVVFSEEFWNFYYHGDDNRFLLEGADSNTEYSDWHQTRRAGSTR